MIVDPWGTVVAQCRCADDLTQRYAALCTDILRGRHRPRGAGACTHGYAALEPAPDRDLPGAVTHSRPRRSQVARAYFGHCDSTLVPHDRCPLDHRVSCRAWADPQYRPRRRRPPCDSPRAWITRGQARGRHAHVWQYDPRLCVRQHVPSGQCTPSHGREQRVKQRHTARSCAEWR